MKSVGELEEPEATANDTVFGYVDDIIPHYSDPTFKSHFLMHRLYKKAYTYVVHYIIFLNYIKISLEINITNKFRTSCKLWQHPFKLKRQNMTAEQPESLCRLNCFFLFEYWEIRSPFEELWTELTLIVVYILMNMCKSLNQT